VVRVLVVSLLGSVVLALLPSPTSASGASGHESERIASREPGDEVDGQGPNSRRRNDPSGRFEPYPGDDGVTSMATSGDITAGDCTYQQGIDNAHISSTSPRAASVHGYWLSISGTCPSKANVDTYLQAYYCDSWGCRWITVATSTGDVFAGGGAGRRVTARSTCKSTKTVGWRGVVDVDLIGVNDPSGMTASTIVNLSCEPS
jgi:hypothetical protein